MKSTPDDSLRLQESLLLNSPSINYPQDFTIHASNLTTNHSNLIRSSPLCLSAAATERLNELDLDLESPILDDRKSLSKKLGGMTQSIHEKEDSCITIRRITSGEYSELMQMHMRIIKRTQGKAYFNRLTTEEIKTFVAYSERKRSLIGFLTWSIESFNRGIIHSIGVRESYQKKGIGTSLLLYACQVMKLNRVETIEVKIEDCEASSIAFFQKHGFQNLSTDVKQSVPIPHDTNPYPGAKNDNETEPETNNSFLLKKSLKSDSENSQLADYSFLGLNDFEEKSTDVSENPLGIDRFMSFICNLFRTTTCCGGGGRPTVS